MLDSFPRLHFRVDRYESEIKGISELRPPSIEDVLSCVELLEIWGSPASRCSCEEAKRNFDHFRFATGKIGLLHGPTNKVGYELPGICPAISLKRVGSTHTGFSRALVL